jgi:hypothetical protein
MVGAPRAGGGDSPAADGQACLVGSDRQGSRETVRGATKAFLKLVKRRGTYCLLKVRTTLKEIKSRRVARFGDGGRKPLLIRGRPFIPSLETFSDQPQFSINFLSNTDLLLQVASRNLAVDSR